MDMRTLLAPADRQASLALQMAKELLEMTDDAVVLVDRLGSFCDVNAGFERLTGYDRLEVIGRPSNLLASGRHDREFYRSMWRALQRGARWEGTVCDKLRDGSHQWFRLRITPLWDEGGNKTHFLGVLSPCAHGHADGLAGPATCAAVGEDDGVRREWEVRGGVLSTA